MTAVATRPPCRHCRLKPAARPRGLCTLCYRAARHLYPSTAPNAPENRGKTLKVCSRCGCLRGANKSEAKYQPVCSTCLRPPGMRGAYHRRIAVYEARAALGLPLFQGGRS